MIAPAAHARLRGDSTRVRAIGNEAFSRADAVEKRQGRDIEPAALLLYATVRNQGDSP